MLVVISPAKRLDWSDVPGVDLTPPAFQDDAVKLARSAGRLSKPQLRKLMDISPELAKLNKERFARFAPEPDTRDLRPAVRAFAGDTYAGLEARSLDADALAWAQDHLRILSGLYGVLRPMDGIQPYRLEMGSRLKSRRGPDLYAWWGDRIARALRTQAETVGATTLVNCASKEYFSAVDTARLGLRVITPVFLEDKPGGPKIVSFFAKKARGAMSRFIVERRLTDPDVLMDFDAGGYGFQPELSSPDAPVFLRNMEAAERAA